MSKQTFGLTPGQAEAGVEPTIRLNLTKCSYDGLNHLTAALRADAVWCRDTHQDARLPLLRTQLGSIEDELRRRNFDTYSATQAIRAVERWLRNWNAELSASGPRYR